MKKQKDCPKVTVNVDAIVDAVKKSIVPRENAPVKVEADVHAHRVKGLGKIGLVPSAQTFSGTEFVVGYSTLPPVINFLSRLSHEGIFLPKIDKTLFRSGATAVNLVAQLLTRKSFLLGSLLGMIPSTLDTLAEVAVDKIKAARAPATVVTPAAEQKGIGQADEELMRLRQDLEKLSGGHNDDDYDVRGSHDDDVEDEVRGVTAGIGGRGAVFER